MSKAIQKQLLLILVLTLVFGVAAYFLAGMVDERISDVIKIRNEVDELTRVAVDIDSKIDERNAVVNYKEMVEGTLPGPNDVISVLEQVELIAREYDLSITLNLEEGIIGSEGIEFKDETSKKAFLKTLEVEDYNPEPQTQAPTTSNGLVNEAVVVEEEEEQEEINISYLELVISMNGKYSSIRKFIEGLQQSRYFYNIKEIRISKVQEGNLSGTMIIRAFIFEDEQ